MRKYFVLVALCACSTIASAQVGEFSASFGAGRFSDSGVGAIQETATSFRNVSMDDGFRMALRMTLNTGRWTGHEFGYGYSRSGISVAGAELAPVSVHSGLYHFLLYATPEGTRVRPFAAGGGHFSSFFPPGADVYYGNQITKFGFNFGGGIKARVTDVWGIRIDVRQYGTGQPFSDFFVRTEGLLWQTEITAGISFNF